MNNLMFPILIALAVVMLVWGIVRVVIVLTDGDSRRLKQRLTQEGSDEADTAQHSLLMQEQTGFSGQLSRLRLFEGLNRRLAQAYPGLSIAKFLGICAACAVGAAVVAIILAPAPLVLLAMVIGGYAPVIAVNARRASRQRQMTLQLPEALDFLSRILRAGHSFSTGLQMMGEELPEPLGSEFRRCHSQHSLGQPLEAALKEMTTRIQSTDFAFFVTAVSIQRQTGGDLTALLNNIGDTVRQRIRLQQQVRAKTAEGRFSGYILVAFPAVMFVIMYSMNPKYVGVMLTDPTGIGMLCTAVGLQMIGLWSIRRITSMSV